MQLNSSLRLSEFTCYTPTKHEHNLQDVLETACEIPSIQIISESSEGENLTFGNESER